MTNNKSLNPLSPDILARVPIQDLIKIILTQMAQIQDQATQIRSLGIQVQAQAEQMISMQETIDQLKDEISYLNNTPKRPKFRPG